MGATGSSFETRGATVFDTEAQLEKYDATSNDSGDEAWVRTPARAVPGSNFVGAKFILDRLVTTPADGNTFVAVGPPGAAGRWVRWDES